MMPDAKNPISWTAAAPNRPAIVMAGSGTTVTYQELGDRVSRLTHLLRSLRLRAGDVVALFSENTPRYHEVLWACRLAGFYFVTINSHLGPDEVAYILDNSGARVLVASANLEVAADLTPDLAPGVEHRLAQHGPIAGYERYETALAAQPDDPPVPGVEGDILQYSSGTTGRPKGIRRELRPAPVLFEEDRLVMFLRAINFREGATYLSPAPLYHTAPAMWSMSVHRFGGTVVVMERFDPREALQAIQDHRVTHGQFVPTMFVRMLKLPDEERLAYDVSSLDTVIHAAAPCPVEVKRGMIEWWGPIISEYWSSSEGAGFTFITAEEWLQHPGSVGRPLMWPLHICDEAGNELPPGEVGTIWAEGSMPFAYLKDPGKDAETTSRQGWRTVGDIGRLDEEGYLFLTDRSSFLIISGGVNIYPQEAENVLVEHPKVLDAGVIGVPHDELGQEVRGVVQPLSWEEAGPDLERELIAWCQARLARYKCPRAIDFERALPRSDTGKLYKKELEQRYEARRSTEPLADPTSRL